MMKARQAVYFAIGIWLVVAATAEESHETDWQACRELLAPDLDGVSCEKYGDQSEIQIQSEKRYFGLGMIENAKPYFYLIEEADNDEPPFPCLLESGALPYCEVSYEGVTGQTIIPVRNTVGYEEGGGVFESIRIHTPGNSQVERADFYKWTRWYQVRLNLMRSAPLRQFDRQANFISISDSSVRYHFPSFRFQEIDNVQIFRMYNGEYKVDDGGRGRSAGRIEAETANAWFALAGSWKRFTGTYTIVKANDASIFQVFTNKERQWSVKLEVDRSGRLRYKERRGSIKFPFGETESALGRPFVVTVCDNGTTAEIFVDGVSMSDGPTNGNWARPNDAKTHFRWGTYVSVKKDNGELNSAVDSIMFVVGSKVEEVQGETCGPREQFSPTPSLLPSSSSSSLPSSLPLPSTSPSLLPSTSPLSALLSIDNVSPPPFESGSSTVVDIVEVPEASPDLVASGCETRWSYRLFSWMAKLFALLSWAFP